MMSINAGRGREQELGKGREKERSQKTGGGREKERQEKRRIY